MFADLLEKDEDEEGDVGEERPEDVVHLRILFQEHVDGRHRVPVEVVGGRHSGRDRWRRRTD